MTSAGTTSWDLIDAAVRGHAPSLASFADRYRALVRNVLAARWRGSSLLLDVDDAVQDVFLQCLRREGPLQRADRSRGTRFRAYLAGIVHNVAARLESEARGRQARHEPLAAQLVQARDESVSQLLDRAWMEMIVRNAGERFRAACRADGADGLRAWEILRLRFEDGLPIRTIAARLACPATAVHVEYRRARRRFRACIDKELHDHADAPADARRLWRELRELLSHSP